MTMKIDFQEQPQAITHRVGPLLIVIGLVSVLQAAVVFPLGLSDYPEAFILLCLGGVLYLGANSRPSIVA